MRLLWSSSNWRKNHLKRSHSSRFSRCRTWVKMAKISCFPKAAEIFWMQSIFTQEYWKLDRFFNSSLLNKRLGLTNFKYLISGFLISLKHISVANKWVRMNFINYYYYKVKESVAHEGSSWVNMTELKSCVFEILRTGLGNMNENFFILIKHRVKSSTKEIFKYLKWEENNRVYETKERN